MLSWFQEKSTKPNLILQDDKESSFGVGQCDYPLHLSPVVAEALHLPEPLPLQMFQLLLLALSFLESPVFMASGKSSLPSVSALLQESCPDFSLTPAGLLLGSPEQSV